MPRSAAPGYYRTTRQSPITVAVEYGIRYRPSPRTLSAENAAHRERQGLHRTPVLVHASRTPYEVPGGRLHGAARARARRAAAAPTPVARPARRGVASLLRKVATR